MSSLSQRLARLRQAGKAPQAAAGRPLDSPEFPNPSGPPLSPAAGKGRADALHRGRRNLTPERPLRGKVEPDTPPPGSAWRPIADFVWERSIEYPPILPHNLDDPFVLPNPTSSGSLVFYDLETTGLSGGAGNTAFLIGLGFHREDGFRVVQLFLSDYPGEASLLQRYAELAGTDSIQVSYNGRSFDSQVLRTRFLLNRMPPLDLPQADLLYPARRLWRGVLSNLTLRTLETEVLGFHRTDDLPGSEAPDAWFEWLAGRPDRIEGVFRHNADDIRSLARLLRRLEDWGAVRSGPHVAAEADAGIPGAVPTEWGMAVQWARRNPERESFWLDRGWRSGNRRCGLELAARLRRSGRLDEARAIWEVMHAADGDYRAAVELAKYWEHREKNPSRALEILDGIEASSSQERRARELAHRRRRLRRKINTGRIPSA